MFKRSSQLVTGPAVEPVTLAQAKAHLRVDFDYEDALIGALISAAREFAENYCQRAFFSQVWTLTLDIFPYTPQPFSSWIDAFSISLPRARVQDVVMITYVDQAGGEHILDPGNYAVDHFSEPARVAPVNGVSWPYPGVFIPGTIVISYVAGSYGDGTDPSAYPTCPLSVCQAILLLVGHFYANREAVVLTNSSNASTVLPFAVQALLDPYKIHSLWG